MFTSRAEHRLLLREDNADTRLTPLGRDLGLVGDAQWEVFCAKQKRAHGFRSYLEKKRLPSGKSVLPAPALPLGQTLAETLRRPDMDLDNLSGTLLTAQEPCLSGIGRELANQRETAGEEAAFSVQTELKYAGYLARQRELVARTAKREKTPLPPHLDYAKIAGLSCEVVEKLKRVQPASLGQAGRISGVTPAAVACLEIHLHKMGLLGRSGAGGQHPRVADAESGPL